MDTLSLILAIMISTANDDARRVAEQSDLKIEIKMCDKYAKTFQAIRKR